MNLTFMMYFRKETNRIVSFGGLFSGDLTSKTELQN